ncbi:hypothetical protein [Corynebacterium sp. A21]|uniref:hypothetical protein n=1 Tax=Corynebacterium sp. A21 TaxID=3457318 RepID=UPI003FD63B32
MSEGLWRPLGIDSDDAIAEYDALHDGVTVWMKEALWRWVREGLTEYRASYDRKSRFRFLDETFTEKMCQRLQISFPNLRSASQDYSVGKDQIARAMSILRTKDDGLQIADYILAHKPDVRETDLDELLDLSKSAWTVGERAGKPGLVRRVPLGVQLGAQNVMDRAGRAGVHLATAWGHLYGLDPDPSAAYRFAILAVEDATIPVVCPNNDRATLGVVARDLAAQGDWHLPMTREDTRSPSKDVVLGMIRVLWSGQHDRHAGQPSTPGNVDAQEAAVAVSLATSLVQLFDAGLVKRNLDDTNRGS